MSPYSNSRSSSTASQDGALSRKNSKTILDRQVSVHRASPDQTSVTSPMSYSMTGEGIAPNQANEDLLARVGLACQVMVGQAMMDKGIASQDMADQAMVSHVMPQTSVASQDMSHATEGMSDSAMESHATSDPAMESHVPPYPAMASHATFDPAMASQAMYNPALASQVMSNPANRVILDQIMARIAFLNRAMAEQTRLGPMMPNQAIQNKPTMSSQSPPHQHTAEHAMQETVDISDNTVIPNQDTSRSEPAPVIPPKEAVTEDTHEPLPSISALLAQLNPGTSGEQGEEAMASDGEEDYEEAKEAAERTETEALHRTGGGVKKRARRFRLTKPKTKRQQHRVKKDAVEKMLREEAEGECFPLSNLHWSPWVQAIRRSLPNKDSWETRPGNHVGARCKRLYDDMSIPAVYEVAVKTPASKTKIPVLSSVTAGNTRGHWESNLLSKPKVKAQVDRVLRRGCKLYFRRAPFAGRDLPGVYEKCDVKRTSAGRVSTQDAVHELRGLMTKVCDYAWRDHYDVESRTYSHRGLIVDGVIVSD